MSDQSTARFVRTEKLSIEIADGAGWNTTVFLFASEAEAITVRDVLNAEFPPEEVANE